MLVVISLSSTTLSEISKKPNRFLTHIFNKYGSNGVINFEGLEHLMHNLGLGDLEFDPGHTVDQHRPDGFKVPDIDVVEETVLTRQTRNHLVDITINDDALKANDGKTPTVTADEKHVPIETTTGDYENGITWKSDDFEDASFASLHNPKHVHHKPHSHDHGETSTLHKSCLSPSAMLRIVINDQRSNSGGNQLNYHVHQDAAQMQHQHRRRRTADNDENSHENESADEFITNIKITPNMFLNMCPALLVQIEQGACSEVTKVELGKEDKAFTMAWVYATVSIAIISLCGLVGIAIVPLAKSIAYDEILRFLIALAIGTLCGDALMHLLPHSLTPHLDHGNVTPLFSNQNADNDPVWLCCCAFMSALFMYSLELLLPLLNGGEIHSHSHGHGHSHTNEQPNVARYVVRGEDDGEVVDMSPSMERPVEDNKELNKMIDDSKIQKRASLSPVAFMVVLGDGLHNLTDGMAIGAAFGMDPVTGMATALAVLCHELPHELGDFALLLQTGVSIKRAMFLNIVSSVLSVIGMIVGLVVAGIHSGFVRWIYAGTAGTFLYIAFADLMPELGRNASDKTLKNSMLQIGGILTGGFIMLAIALNEDRLRVLFE